MPLNQFLNFQIDLKKDLTLRNKPQLQTKKIIGKLIKLIDKLSYQSNVN